MPTLVEFYSRPRKIAVFTYNVAVNLCRSFAYLVSLIANSTASSSVAANIVFQATVALPACFLFFLLAYHSISVISGLFHQLKCGVIGYQRQRLH